MNLHSYGMVVRQYSIACLNYSSDDRSMIAIHFSIRLISIFSLIWSIVLNLKRFFFKKIESLWVFTLKTIKSEKRPNERRTVEKVRKIKMLAWMFTSVERKKHWYICAHLRDVKLKNKTLNEGVLNMKNLLYSHKHTDVHALTQWCRFHMYGTYIKWMQPNVV